jgi:predicted nucleotidyltransferase component of viral defense system
MTLEEIRRSILAAVASDDALANSFVLKGGNALELVYKIGQRSSLDLDFSTPQDFDDAREVQARLFRALKERFASAGIEVFDEKFGPRPSNRKPGARWGGYNAEFKLIPTELHRTLAGDWDSMRRRALESGPNHERRFRIEISAFEYCEGKKAVKIDQYTCYAYTVEMVAVEKLRAICQQMPEYAQRLNPAPRARDFYDIWASVVEAPVDFSSGATHELVRHVFKAKEVELWLMSRIHEHREFHRADWPSVVNAVRTRLRRFDFYFEFVLGEVET